MSGTVMIRSKSFGNLSPALEEAEAACVLEFYSCRIPCDCLVDNIVKAKSQPGEILSNARFIEIPSCGSGFGRGHDYFIDKVTPWKEFCSNCYAAAANHSDHETTDVARPEECKCNMAWYWYWYCSHECRDEHWPTHKHLCKRTTGTREERKRRKILCR